MMNVATEQDFIDIANKLGFDVEITNGQEVGTGFPYTFPYFLSVAGKVGRFTMFVKLKTQVTLTTFPYTFPYIFGETSTSILECIYETIKPANVNVVFIVEE